MDLRLIFTNARAVKRKLTVRIFYNYFRCYRLIIKSYFLPATTVSAYEKAFVDDIESCYTEDVEALEATLKKHGIQVNKKVQNSRRIHTF